MRRYLFVILLGIPGLAVLLGLGVWQMQRLDWKQDILAEMESRIAARPVELPMNPSEDMDEYLAVRLTGTPTGDELHVLSSGTAAGTGYRVISAWHTDMGRRIMVDMGIMPLDRKRLNPDIVTQNITGNLLWPNDAADKSPAPDLENNLWFARDAAAMAEVLQAEPFMVVLRDSDNPDRRITMVPVDTSNIKNDHREYAITWFLLALVWAAMTGYFVYRSNKAGQKD
ncbi:hypothetical protein BVC71_09255 [Marivivens niveibacter]|uniref:SURF1-like protein n=1 Tax=Marivivens niveibacter TaxID=1930667 RepID=A0A251WWQ4_9RHOB|nr:SURF1 family protein [Marivivens niveibacter]OUD08899.1 hypothetical protein BVC71_09255 [Marivivens niveibacter]